MTPAATPDGDVVIRVAPEDFQTALQQLESLKSKWQTDKTTYNKHANNLQGTRTNSALSTLTGAEVDTIGQDYEQQIELIDHLIAYLKTIKRDMLGQDNTASSDLKKGPGGQMSY
jgi:hypothetical protein